MKPQDFPFAVELANTLSWDMANIDFEYMSMLEPAGCFVLWEGHERIGMATCVNYGRVGWFGNLAVKPEFRRKGAGTFLVRHAVRYLRKKGVKAVGLYAYQHLAGFYGKIGFKPLDDFVVLNGVAQKTKKHRKDFSETVEKNAQALIDFDLRCMGWNRKKLIKSLLRETSNICHYRTEKDQLQGFIVAKAYGAIAEIGPLVCSQEQSRVAIGLVENVLAELAGVELYAYASLSEPKILQLLLRAGLKEKFRVTRMYLGSLAAENCVYMPESLERG